MNESHLPRVLRTNSHAKFSPNEGVIDEICNILKVLSIVLTERKKKKDKFRMQRSRTLLGSHPASITLADFTEALTLLKRSQLQGS